jgi:NADH-quinone oxidoreductase subunit F
MYRGGKLKAYIPGGASAAILTADQAHLALDFDTMTKAGSMLGSAAVMVMDDTTCMVRSVARLAKFFNHESCGQCTPCREGTNWLELLLTRIEHGAGRPGDPQLLRSVCKNMNGTALCALAEAAVGPVDSLIKRFPDEVEQHIRDHACPFPHRRYFADGAS